MEIKKSTRIPLRTTFMKTANLLEEAIGDSDPDAGNLKVLISQLSSKWSRLKKLDKEILEMLTTDAKEGESDNYDTEFEIIESYNDRYVFLKTKTKNLLNKLDSQREESGLSSECAVSTRKYKLPEIEIKKFNGDIKNWLSFWGQFRKIHEDPEIMAEDKYQYLVQATEQGSRARYLVDSFPPTADNYPQVIDCLKSRFGRDEILVEVYIRELLSLVIQNSQNPVKNISLSKLYDTIEAHLRSLETLGVSEDKYAAMLYPMVESSLPLELMRIWERNVNSVISQNTAIDRNMTKLALLMKFLKNEVQGEERISVVRSGFGLGQKERKTYQKSLIYQDHDIPTAVGLFTGDKDFEKPKRDTCIFCKNPHASHECQESGNMSFEEKKKIIMRRGYSFVCLKFGHRSAKCKLKLRCPVCEKRHYAILCPNLPNKSNSSVPTKQDCTSNSSKDNALSNQACCSEVLLQSLMVKLRGRGTERVVRALCDSGSQKSYITQKAAASMGYECLGKEKMVHCLFGGTESPRKTHNRYLACVSNLDNTYECKIAVLDQPKICGEIRKIPKGVWLTELEEYEIALTDTNKLQSESTEIEILLGADVIGKLLTGRLHKLKCGPVAIETNLGWTLMGKIPIISRKSEDNTLLVTSLFAKNNDIANLWELDIIGITDPVESKSRTEVQKETMSHFLRTVKRDTDGRYQVALPWIEGHATLSSNHQLAEKRLKSSLKKMTKEGTVGAYQTVLDNWLNENIIEEVSPESHSSLCYYLPHRPVIKETSETTKIRPVFDASSHEKGSPSLNDCLLKGPNLIELIPSVVNRFRMGSIGVISDIEKAFLQIEVAEKERDFLRFLWYEAGNEKFPKVYRHRRVVFGVSSSPFLLSATLAYHLEQSSSLLPETVQKLKNSFYVDNCLASFDNMEEVKQFIVDSEALLSAAKFNLRGWKYNQHKGYLDQILSEVVPVLGLSWNLECDEIYCDVSKLKDIDSEYITKRGILSAAHKIYDPIGFSCPVTIIPKLLLQEIWQLKVGWDEELPKELAKRFTSWVSQLDTLDSIKIPRWLNLDKSEEQDISMHVFCDASKNAYATCIYLRVETKDTTNVQLVQARSRVAPLKKMTIPRLELMACCIGCRLAETVKSDMEKPHMKTYYWSDSTNALCWIRRETQWATFVRNRVKEILTLTEPEEWHHISGIDNPADLPSRGCTTKHLIKLRWWEGPDWLKLPEEKWLKSEEVPDEEIVIAEKQKTVISAPCMPKQYSWYYERFSSFVKIVRMIAWLKRFCCNARKASFERKLDELSTSEIEEAQIIIFCLVQQESFQGSGNKSIKPFKLIVDSRGILRLKTSLIFREDTADFRYPILLPANHPVVELLILWEHQTLSHAGVSVLMSTLRERFWILKSRKTIQKALRKCGRCRRFQAKRAEMDPAPLPESRVRDANIFEIVGIDLAGPLFLRGKIKAWIVLFTCAIYRAVHLELALSLSTEAFLQSLRRFIARRGRPSLIYTDNGTNFVGANSAFASLDWSSIISETLFQRIEWKFNPPTAAWWGGWWERLIRMVKTILRKVLGRACLSYEEVLTILCDTEQVINSRPLTYVSEEVEDLVPITPMMFLREISTSNVRDIDELNHVACNKRMRYEQKIRENLRKRFRSEYVGQLRQPMIGRNRSTPIRVEDIVLVECDSQRSKRIDWPLAKVLELYPGRDGLARVAKIKTRSGELVRPIQRLFPLELAMRETEREDPSRFLNKTDKLGTIKTPPQTRSGRTVIPPDKLCY